MEQSINAPMQRKENVKIRSKSEMNRVVAMRVPRKLTDGIHAQSHQCKLEVGETDGEMCWCMRGMSIIK